MKGKSGTSNFMIGLFVTLGVIMGVAAVIWLGAAQYFQKGARYVTYFDESVQGLSADSSVKYRGVEVGRVEQIGVAPDNVLIEVVMKIDMEDELARDTVAQLRAVGITGLVFIELNRPVVDASERTVKIDFDAPYPVIPSIPSEISRIFSTIDEVIQRIHTIDLKDTIEGLHSIVTSVKTAVGDGKMERIGENLDRATARLDTVIRGVEATLTETRTTLAKAGRLMDKSHRTLDQMKLAKTAGALETTITEAGKVLEETRSLIADSRTAFKEMELAKGVKNAGMLMEDLDNSVRLSAIGIRNASESLQQASRALEGLIERLSVNPSDILFSSPPQERRE